MVKWVIFNLNFPEIRRNCPKIGLKMSIFDQKFRYVENRQLSPNPILMYSDNVKDSENADRWLATLTIHQ